MLTKGSGWGRQALRAAAWSLAIATFAWGSPEAWGQAAAGTPAASPDERPTLYVTATAHLDTQWLWTIQKTIDEYIPSTLRGNFALFEKFPNYVFSFEGSFRYMLAREYYPEDYEKLREYVDQGRWRVCGSSVDAGDVNVPSPESLIRNILYGNNFFEQEFGRRSCDIYLPDCFGFGYALPTVAAHCGLRGFSTQKLTWGSSVGIPFDIGVWEGVDGSSVVAALNPGSYTAKLRTDLSTDEEWITRARELGEKSGFHAGYKYFGVGDIGGAPDDESVSWLEKAIGAKGSPLRVISAPADQLYRDLTAEQIARLPRFKGEILMTRHGTGCYTSQCAMKRWNRKNELLADAAERASVAATWLGGADYPQDKLNEAWVRFLWHQFHDDLPGTSIPEAYTFSWNDEVIALNQFAAVLTNAVGAVCRGLNTAGTNLPLVVFNPLAFDRQDVVEATVRLPDASPDEAGEIGVFDAEGREVPSQVMARDADEVQLAFLARVPSVGFAVYDVRRLARARQQSAGLEVSESGIENGRYRVRLNDAGDVASIYDKTAKRELLASPARLALFRNTPDYWSEWEIRYEDIAAEPYAYVGGPAAVKVVEDGAVRATIEVVREAEGSVFTQRISLAEGEAGDRVEFDTRIDWQTPKALLKAVFPLTASNEMATYDLGCGVIERPNNTETKYEVPAQQWADLSDADEPFGVTILNDCKYGWDKPDDNTLRLTLIHSPNDIEKDMGWHRMKYAVAGHYGDRRHGMATRKAARLNQPPVAFATTAHDGPLGKEFSLLKVNTPEVVVRAVKKAEASDEIVVRLQEVFGGEPQDVRLKLAAPIAAVREVTGAETPLPPGGGVTVDQGGLLLSFRPYQPRTFAIRLADPSTRLSRPIAKPAPLPFDLDVVSADRDRSDGDFDGAGHTLPAELLPRDLVLEDVPFRFGPTSAGALNALACRGQTLALPDGDFNRLFIIAAAAGGPAEGTFLTGDRATRLSIHEFTGWIGQADSLVVDGRVVDAERMVPAFIDRDEIAWVGTHRHDGSTDRNEPYVFCYLFKYGLDLPSGASTVTLPDEERIRILAMTAVNLPAGEVVRSSELYDHLSATHIQPHGGLLIEPVRVRLAADAKDAEIVYTLDGSQPDANSTRYSGPFEVSATTTVSARTLRRGRLDERATRAKFTFATPRDAERVPDAKAGLVASYYQGEWKALPDFDALAPVKTGTVDTFDVSQRDEAERYGVVFAGYVSVPRDGVYTFYCASDDGSRLYVGGVQVVENDGLHSTRERRGRIALKAGAHPIRVEYFQRTGGEELVVSYEGPGIKKQVVPAEALLR